MINIINMRSPSVHLKMINYFITAKLIELFFGAETFITLVKKKYLYHYRGLFVSKYDIFLLDIKQYIKSLFNSKYPQWGKGSPINQLVAYEKKI